MENFSLFEKEEKIECKPFIKWVGGKGQLIPEISKLYPVELGKTINKYAEIFIGGGAVLFDVLSKYKLDEVYISDKNLELINTYLDNSTMYVPYDDPKSSGDFNSLVTQLNAYGVKENERVAQILSFKLQTLRDHFVDKPNSRKRGTKYKAIYRNKKVLEMVRHSLTLILNTEDKTRWLTF